MPNPLSIKSVSAARLGNPMVGLGSTLATGMAVFALLGVYIGKKTGHVALGSVLGVFLGLFFCGYEVWKLVRKNRRDAGPTGDQDHG